MPYRDDEDEEEDYDDDDDRDLPQAADMDDDEDGDDADDLVPCPYCGKGVYEGAEVCPHCKSYLSAEDAPPRRRSVWLIVGVVVCIVLVLFGWLLM